MGDFVFGLALVFFVAALAHGALTGLTAIGAKLRFVHAVALLLVSMVLTLISGIIPSLKAAKKDPVEALRSE